MANTTNFGWETPDDTDLVKDGALAMRTLGSAIDTSLVDLKGGTTGQVLSKASNTDMDFTWATDASGIPATIFDAKGDLIAASAADTAARLAVGSNGQVLTADSTTSTGLKWASAASGGMTVIASGTLTTTGTTLSSLSQSYKDLILVLRDFYPTSGPSGVRIRLNGVSGSVYPVVVSRSTSSSNGTATNPGFYLDDILTGPATSAQGSTATFKVLDYTTTSNYKTINATYAYTNNASVITVCGMDGVFTNTGNISSIGIDAPAGNLMGTYVLYGVN